MRYWMWPRRLRWRKRPPRARRMVRKRRPHRPAKDRLHAFGLSRSRYLWFIPALMIAIAAVQGSFKTSSLMAWSMTYAFVVSGYAFCISLPLAAVVGHRGLSNEGPPAARAVYAGNLVGAWGSMIGALLLVHAAFVSL